MRLRDRWRCWRERLLACFGIIDERRADEGLVAMVEERRADGDGEWIPIEHAKRDLGL